MLQLLVPHTTLWDEKDEVFIHVKAHTLQLEHSLVSLSKWESKWMKPFLSKSDKTREEIEDYVRCMTLTQNVDPNVYKALKSSHIRQIQEYIDSPMTATTFAGEGGDGKEIVTAEIIYYWMIAFTVPFECQKWHLNRLLTLIRVCSIKNEAQNGKSKQKTPRSAQIAERNALNAKRKAQYNSRG